MKQKHDEANNNTPLWCLYCGKEFPFPSDGEVLARHIYECEKHPISFHRREIHAAHEVCCEMQAEHDEAVAAIRERIAELRLLEQEAIDGHMNHYVDRLRTEIYGLRFALRALEGGEG